MDRFRRWSLAVASLGTSLLVMSPTASAAQQPASKSSPVVVFGDTPQNTPVTVSFVLRIRSEPQLQHFIQHLQLPGPQFRRYLSVSEFASRYGQPLPVIQKLQSYLGQYGIHTTVYPDHLVVTAQGTAGAFDQALKVRLKNMQYHHKIFHGTSTRPALPTQFSHAVLAILGLTNYASFTDNLVGAIGSTPETSNTQAPPAGMLTPQFVASHYNLTTLYNHDNLGQGHTIGIVTLAGFQPSDAYAFWHFIHVSVMAKRISVVNVDGGAGVPSLSSGSAETTVDVEQSGALAPQAHIIVYEAPNAGGYGFVDAYFTALSQNQAGSISSSWGTSETAVQKAVSLGLESPNYYLAFNEAYMEGAAQGVSMFAAAGDAGAYSASRAPGGPTNLSVGMPSDSPYVTSAGGTTLPGTQVYPKFSVTIPYERTWGWDYLYPYWHDLGASSEASWATSHVVGGGGGYSALYPTPWYQANVPGVNRFTAIPWLTPINGNTAWQFNPDPSLIQGQATGRNIPDLAMNADPQTGYAVYSTLFGGNDWRKIGGTSFVAPQLAGITAVINGFVGTRVGWWNPQIYSFAQHSPSPFHPLDASGATNDNLYYTGTAGSLYNPGSGLGTPNFGLLAQDFKH